MGQADSGAGAFVRYCTLMRFQQRGDRFGVESATRLVEHRADLMLGVPRPLGAEVQRT
jgi:hypothetical protein